MNVNPHINFGIMIQLDVSPLPSGQVPSRVFQVTVMFYFPLNNAQLVLKNLTLLEEEGGGGKILTRAKWQIKGVFF